MPRPTTECEFSTPRSGPVMHFSRNRALELTNPCGCPSAEASPHRATLGRPTIWRVKTALMQSVRTVGAICSTTLAATEEQS